MARASAALARPDAARRSPPSCWQQPDRCASTAGSGNPVRASGFVVQLDWSPPPPPPSSIVNRGPICPRPSRAHSGSPSCAATGHPAPQEAVEVLERPAVERRVDVARRHPSEPATERVAEALDPLGDRVEVELGTLPVLRRVDDEVSTVPAVGELVESVRNVLSPVDLVGCPGEVGAVREDAAQHLDARLPPPFIFDLVSHPRVTSGIDARRNQAIPGPR